MKVYKNVKSVAFNVTYQGNGCVNRDGPQQKDIINAFNFGNITYNNVEFSKKMISSDDIDKDKKHFRIRVSRDCIRHYMFLPEIPADNPHIAENKRILYTALANPAYSERGYTYPFPSKQTVKRGRVTNITDAVSTTTHQKLNIETCARTGHKNLNTVDKEGKDNSLFHREVVGEETYVSKNCLIDVKNLQIIKDDPVLGNWELGLEDGSKEERLFLNNLERNMINFKPAFKLYSERSSAFGDELAERGILFNKESVDMMIKDILRRILHLYIACKGATFYTTSVEVTVIMTDDIIDEHGHLKKLHREETFMLTDEILDNVFFDYYPEYIEADEEKIRRNLKEMEEGEIRNEDIRRIQNERKKHPRRNNESPETENEDVIEDSFESENILY